MSPTRSTRRRFLSGAAGAAAVSVPAVAQAGRVRAFDHVALPMQNSDAMIAFYRDLGMQVQEGPRLCTVHFGDNMINFHRPAAWQDPTFTNRAPAAKPPCGDLCFVWEGNPEALQAMLQKAGAKVETGPVKRQGGRDSGKLTGSSIYVRDPDGNLLEFMIYGSGVA